MRPAPLPPFTPVTLTGAHVRLEPLTLAHLTALTAVGLDPDLWAFTTIVVRTPDDMRRYVETALAEQARGSALPFAQVDVRSGDVIGSTRLANYEPQHHRVEIGWTWLAKPFQRTPTNTEAKRLLLAHAFDTLGAARVELKTSARNVRSRAAIARIGAVEEGTLRRHMINESGETRDTVYFSVLRDEWPAVRAALDARLAPQPELQNSEPY
ncbi:N-acetyltransferase [Gemmatimonadetes bacterium T265]|nr:N-acetyltransferase [Gemmatimonadetes bacterium T265]